MCAVCKTASYPLKSRVIQCDAERLFPASDHLILPSPNGESNASHSFRRDRGAPGIKSHPIGQGPILPIRKRNLSLPAVGMWQGESHVRSDIADVRRLFLRDGRTTQPRSSRRAFPKYHPPGSAKTAYVLRCFLLAEGNRDLQDGLYQETLETRGGSTGDEPWSYNNQPPSIVASI